jgi:hypothetical protein
MFCVLPLSRFVWLRRWLFHTHCSPAVAQHTTCGLDLVQRGARAWQQRTRMWHAMLSHTRSAPSRRTARRSRLTTTTTVRDLRPTGCLFVWTLENNKITSRLRVRAKLLRQSFSHLFLTVRLAPGVGGDYDNDFSFAGAPAAPPLTTSTPFVPACVCYLCAHDSRRALLASLPPCLLASLPWPCFSLNVLRRSAAATSPWARLDDHATGEAKPFQRLKNTKLPKSAKGHVCVCAYVRMCVDVRTRVCSCMCACNCACM